MYVKEAFSAREVKFPEQVWCKIKCNGNQELLVGVCYRTPSENVYGYEIHDKMRNLVSEIFNKNFVLFGDFNYRGIDWAVNCYDSLNLRLFDCLNDE